ncbi:hypothetical protein F5X99DRAFT_370705 [Biscogniauxia marginata]|nr:hypothetical protein F5X99DRAFT_370705 [Biscogniauxia marginata]
MGQCPIINIKEILDDTFIRIQTGCHSCAATVNSAPRGAGNRISLSFYGRYKGISTSELDHCVNHWVRLAWSLPSGSFKNKAMQITWHRLATFKTPDVQFMSMQFSLYISMSMSQSLKHRPKQQTHAQWRPNCQSGVKMCQNQACLRQPKLLSDRCNVGVSKRRSSLRTCPSRLGFMLSTNYNIGLQVTTSNTTSQTSSSRDSDENRLASNSNTATSSISVDGDHSRPHECEISPMDVNGQQDLSDTEDDRMVEADIQTDFGDQSDSYPSLKPVSEYQANLEAVSPECKDLFLEATAHVKEETDLAEDDSIDKYWTWCPDRQQWFHEDTDCNTIVWFPKDFD